MYRTYDLYEEEMDKPRIAEWDGDCFIYTVFESEEEMKQEKERRAKIEKEYEEAMQAYLATLKD